ncbi:beta-ketoacyl-[acyl-carrier-protein] synthase family protein [Streptomyces netropsis]|uniref:3-oxoacyl-[acyl-carrier-protein] synthase II n=1 Tax=Streptomyces netropsis TaxID=55404 RepID=A0A7W7L8K3_STRNE|nr:beta-ketoacyl-[acyl-carrier-protein] synthase family protein [Streptomyces netropsis]MBB4885464.1 3-oxoacyl-[acyl-carrier-protein] synthase II [Streptomyces netropsis]GGR38356.1 3-oxoacyl-[acyl-carrier-protein] synthase 2 [Streptomyces netropsis]
MSGRAAVTGFGAVTPLGVGADVLHRRAVEGASGLVAGRGLCADFTPEEFLGRKEVRRADRFTHLAVAAADEALGRAGWSTRGSPPYPPERVACVIGTGVGGVRSHEAQLARLAQHGDAFVSALLAPMMMPNAAAAHLAMRYGLRGESYCVASACAAGAQAIGSGLRILAAGEADAVVVGGAEAAVSPVLHAGFRNAGALSPTGRSVPFARDRDGFLPGEGAGILVLERPEAAAARGATVLGEILGYGATSDAHHLTAPEPSARAAARAVTTALEAAGRAPHQIAYVNAHGTGTVLNDRAEATALRLALGEHLAAVPISSSKSYLGHLLGAAGAVEAIATLQALRHATAPPTVGLRDPDERLGKLDHVHTARSLPADGRPTALSTSFGFGGHNAVLVLAAGATEGGD